HATSAAAWSRQQERRSRVHREGEPPGLVGGPPVRELGASAVPAAAVDAPATDVDAAKREGSMDDERFRGSYERSHDPTRVLALSDGVFAIIITLLVLEIHVPDLAQGQTLREALREVRPSFVSFLISFVVVAIAWAGHRDLFALIHRTDRMLVWLNILYLL